VPDFLCKSPTERTWWWIKSTIDLNFEAALGVINREACYNPPQKGHSKTASSTIVTRALASPGADIRQ